MSALIVERLRRIWTPEREVDELFTDLSPRDILDSEIREYFSRIVDQQGTIKLDLTNPVPAFNIRWEIVHFAETNRREITIWKEEG